MPTGNDRRIVTPDFYEAIRQVFEQEMLDFYSAMPGRISSYNSTTHLATIQPSLQVKYRDESDPKNRPLISNVPVIFPKMGKAHLRFPIEAGQEGLILWSQRSIDKWITSGGIVDPEDNRKFDYSDAFFLPGAVSQPNRIVNKGDAANTELANDEMVIELLPSGKIKIKNSEVELLQVLVNLLDELLAAKVLTMLGPQPFIVSTIAKLNLVKADLEKLKG